jgi:hypothetical protein
MTLKLYAEERYLTLWMDEFEGSSLSRQELKDHVVFYCRIGQPNC